MATDMFLKLSNGIKGESQADKHKDEIDVLAWSWGMSQSGTMHTGLGGGSGKVQVQDLSITKYLESCSPILMKFCASGQKIDEGILTVRKAGGNNPLDYFTITMKDCIITSVSTGGSGGEDRLTENIAINFREFKVVYTTQNPDGTAGGQVPFGFDIAKNLSL